VLAQLHLQAGAMCDAGCDSMSSPPVVVPVFNNQPEGCTAAELPAMPPHVSLFLVCGQLARSWASYFVFTVTRAPLDRAVSQYSFLLRSNLAEPPSCADAVRAVVHLLQAALELLLSTAVLATNCPVWAAGLQGRRQRRFICTFVQPWWSAHAV